MADFFYCTTVLLQLGSGWFLLFHHCFIAIMSWLISSMAPMFYCNCDLADFFYCTTVLLQLWLRWFLPLHHCFIAIMTCLVFLLHHCFITIRIRLISFVSPLFYCYYELADFFYCTTVLLQLWLRWFLLLHHCFIAIKICLFSCIAPRFYCNYD